MATPTPYFLYPFGSSGTATAIPPTGASVGAVSYQYGFTPNYEADLSSDPSALPVPRPQFNQLMLDITSALKYIQTQGVPAWVSSGTGGPVNYPLLAWVGHDPGTGYQVWESQITANTSEPGTDGNWIPISGGAVVQAGTVQWFSGMNGLSGSLKCDGSLVPRTTYARLFESLTLVQTAITGMGSTTLTVTSTADLSIGPKCNIEAVGVTPGTYIAAILSPTTLQMSAVASASGTVTGRFFTWGAGDGSTTFALPYLVRQVVAGAGGVGNTVLGGRMGQSGGADTYTQKLSDMVNHTHNAAGANFVNIGAGGVFSSGGAGGSTTFTAGVAGHPGTQTAMNVIQQTTNLWAYVKY